MKETEIIKNILQNPSTARFKEIYEYAREVYNYDIPENPDEISDLEKEDMEMIVKKLNMLGSVNMLPVSRNQLRALHEHTLDLWNSPPETPQGEWVEWCLWHHSRRFDDPPIESAQHGGSSNNLRERIGEYVDTRSNLYKQRVVENSENYDDPTEVSDRLRDLYFQPLLSASNDEN